MQALKQMSIDQRKFADGRLHVEQAVGAREVAVVDLTSDIGSTSTQTASEPQDATSAMVGELIDVSILEGSSI